MGDLPVLLRRASRGGLEAIVDRCPCCGLALSARGDGADSRAACPRHGEIDERAERVPRLEARGGLLFGSLDPEALPLADWLGDLLPWFDRAVAPGLQGEGTLPWSYAGNWKLAVEHGCDAARGDRALAAGPGSCILRGETVTSISLFPNLSFDATRGLLHVWHPVAPDRTQVETICVSAAGATAEMRIARRRAAMLGWGQETQAPATAWQAITAGAAAPLLRRVPVVLLDAESGARAFYGWWAERLRHANERPARADRLHLTFP
jgi:hypothetical protein